MKVRIISLTALIAVCLLFNLSLRVPNPTVVQAQVSQNCPTTDVPSTVVGRAGNLEDQFMLREPLRFTLLEPDGDASFFTTNDMNFGGNATLPGIARAGGTAKGLRISRVGGRTVAVSCRESFWDINFMLASMGATAGDKIRLFMQPDESGRGAFDLARFEVAQNSGAANLTFLESSATLYANGHVQQRVGASLPYSIGAGQSGRRTDQITIVLSMDPRAPTMRCLHLGVEIVRDGGQGTTSLVLNTVVLTREGPANGTGTGLFTGQQGTYPTRMPCDRACPTCRPTCVQANIPMTTIGTNDDQFLLRDPFRLTLVNAEGDVSFFGTNDLNFGGNATLPRIAQAGGVAQGLRATGINSRANALSCREHVWDINLMIAGMGATAGDRIRLYMQQDDNGRGAFDLATFVVAPGGGGVNLTQLESSARLYGNGHVEQRVNSFLAFSAPAGSSGRRTDQITIALSMDPRARTAGCQHLGVEILRDGGNGTTTVVFNTVIVVRDRATTATGTGLFTGQIGTYPTRPECDLACPSCCPMTEVPSTAVGRAGNIEDQFMLREPLKFTLLEPDGDAAFFATNDANFGGNATLPGIARAGGTAKGLRVSRVGGRTVAVSCRESFWDINFMLAGMGVTAGDRVRLFMQPDDTGRRAFDLARFTVGAGGATLSYLEPSATLFANGHIQQRVGAFLPYNLNAGSSGRRTDQITIALSMDSRAPTMACLHLGVEIIRDGGQGTTSLVFNTIVLVREGPANGTGTGLFTGQQGTYPTRVPCDRACPRCE
jgi:hypothetical protein